jgi:hypothetical protein
MNLDLQFLKGQIKKEKNVNLHALLWIYSNIKKINRYYRKKTFDKIIMIMKELVWFFFSFNYYDYNYVWHIVNFASGYLNLSTFSFPSLNLGFSFLSISFKKKKKKSHNKTRQTIFRTREKQVDNVKVYVKAHFPINTSIVYLITNTWDLLNLDWMR